MNERDLFDESVLRRALRLEEDERAPRVLLAGLASARPARGDAFAPFAAARLAAARLAAGAWLVLAGLAVAALLGGVVDGAAVLAPALAADLFEDAIGLAVPLSDGLALSALFVSPLTLVATAAAALLYVRVTERGADHVHAS